MSAHLLVISLGPVQDFISAARRTRDLWFGSHLLSEISKAAAVAVQNAGGKLIFPAPASPHDLEKNSEFNVANIILAELPENVDPAAARRDAEAAAQAQWLEFANNAKAFASVLIDSDLWNDQVTDVIEFYAAWVPLESPQQYGDARRRLMRLLAGRKALRDFKPAKGREQVPKSSLDGARETVLIRSGSELETRKERRRILEENNQLAQQLRLSAGEELDVIGITKRAATREVFPSVTRVAADPWLRGIEREPAAHQLLNEIAQQCRDASFAAGTGRYYRRIFSYDGAVLFPSRLASMLRPPKKDEGDSYDADSLLSSQDRQKLMEIKSRIERLQKNGSGRMGLGEPSPYLAVLAADGDRMGQAISRISSAEDHRKFSQQLAQFASAASSIVENNGHGCLIYSGGDDVLAIMPVDTCLRCARALHDQFAGLLDKWKDDEGKSPTLSVGIVIGHCQESLEDLLEFARDAERTAKKPDRDGVAVRLYTRGGVPVMLRSGWSDKLDERIAEWTALHRDGQIPDKFAYDLRQLATVYEDNLVKPDWDPSNLKTALQKDALLLIKRKASKRASEGLAKAERLLAVAECAADARRIADEIIVAAHINEIEQQTREHAPAVANPENAI